MKPHLPQRHRIARASLAASLFLAGPALLLPPQTLAQQQATPASRRGEPITPALYDAGYGSSSRLYEKAAGQLGMTPGAYRRGGEGERIRFAVVGSALGPILVAATGRGLCRVTLGRTGPQLTASLRLEFPGATLEEDAKALRVR